MGTYEQSVEMARHHERAAERAKDRMTREYFGDVPKSPLLPNLDAPRSPEEPQTVSEWLEHMDADEWFSDQSEILLNYSEGGECNLDQMRQGAERMRSNLVYATDLLEAFGDAQNPAYLALCGSIVGQMIKSAENYRGKTQ